VTYPNQAGEQFRKQLGVSWRPRLPWRRPFWYPPVEPWLVANFRPDFNGGRFHRPRSHLQTVGLRTLAGHYARRWDQLDDVADSYNSHYVLFSYLAPEMVLQRKDDIYKVETIGTEVFDQASIRHYTGVVDVLCIDVPDTGKVVNDDLPDMIREVRHGVPL
jgi:hypothetical protein